MRPGARLVVGLSGGIDSVTLLAVLAELAGPLQFSLKAVHVHHGISPCASDWVQFCERLCRRLQVPLQIEKVNLDEHRALGLEGAARHARYEIFARVEADFIVLAHHRDDQVETLLLQLLRGAGPLGMAGMPALRALAGSHARILRPMLDLARSDIEAWARDRGLEWIEDESNEDLARQRNFIRHSVLPLIEQQVPAVRTTVARASRHLAEAGELLAVLGQMDLEALGGDAELEVEKLLQLGAARGRNALRFLCRSRGIRFPTEAQADELYRQLVEAREDRVMHVDIHGWRFHRYRGRLCIERVRAAVPASFRAVWRGEPTLPLLDLGGVLKFKPEEGRGLNAQRLQQAEVSVRMRAGGEHLQPDAKRPRRTLKNLLHERGIPPWQRECWPLLYCGEALVSVPGIGDECDWQAGPGEPGLIVSWEPLE